MAMYDGSPKQSPYQQAPLRGSHRDGDGNFYGTDAFGNSAAYQANNPGFQPTRTSGGHTTGGASANLGGSTDAYIDERNRLSGLAGGANAGAFGEYDNAMHGRAMQLGDLARLSSIANGQLRGPAALQQQRSYQDAMAAQSALGASARGSAGLASGLYNAGQNRGMMQQHQVGDAAAVAAEEQANAREQYLRGVAQMQQMNGAQIDMMSKGGLGWQQVLNNRDLAQLQAQSGAAAQSLNEWGYEMGQNSAARTSTANNITGAAGAGSGALSTMLDSNDRRGA